MLRTLLTSFLVLMAGTLVLAAATDGGRAFTSEAARRLAVREQPRPVPDVRVQTAAGQSLTLAELRGRWLLVDFIYTRCETFCSVQGSAFARLQDRLVPALDEDRLRLLSISFDPAHDDPAALADWQRRSGDRGRGWIAARPVAAGDLAALLDAFEVVAVPDGMGGWVHNAALAIVDPSGRIVAIRDWNDITGAVRELEARRAAWPG